MANELYPIFLKVSQLKLLIVGGGHVALEKLTFLLKSSPQARVSLVAKNFLPAVQELGGKHGFNLTQKHYEASDLEGFDIVIGATDDDQVNRQIYRNARARNVLVNIADNPPLCDFYMGGIVTKGNLKIAISTNGKSPTMAKRLRQYFEETIPENINDLLDNLNVFRKTLKQDFQYKVNELNELTKSMLENRITNHD